MPPAVQAQTDLEAHPPGTGGLEHGPGHLEGMGTSPSMAAPAPCLRTLATEQPMLRSNQP